jgi:23S rRNA (uracil1939-C5)-methyltransferase
MSSTPPEPVLHPGQHYTVTVEKLTFGGSGLAHVEGFPVFIDDAIPGQQLEIVVTKRRDRYMEAKIHKVLRHAKDEIQSKCKHFGECGGCQWQNLAYDKQLSYKEDIVRETLEHLTQADEAVRKQLPGRVLKIIPSPQVYHYRNKLEMSFGYGTMRVEEKDGRRIHFDENPTIGFHRPGEWSTMLPITECHLYDEQTDMLLADVRRFMEQSRLPVYNPKIQKGMLRNMLLRRGQHTGEQMICFLVNARKKELEPLFQPFLRAFGGRPNLKSLMIIEHLGLNDRPEFPKVHMLTGKETISERLFDLNFEISPFSFFQTNTFAAEKLYRAIAEAADLSQKDTVLDAYCGMGTIGQYLARFCQKVVGVESHPSAVDDALKSAGKNKIGNISFYKGRTEQVMKDQLKAGGKYAFTTIVVDPPRPGLHPAARDAVIEHKADKVVYVSCNTATFARDLGEFLKAGYELRTVQPVDLFPHTAHIETVALLQRK